MSHQHQHQHQPHQRHFLVGDGGGGGNNAGNGLINDTTFTKIFVGGLAWETHRETMKRYFEQFGEILEAVVITDKNTGRSKGYGFVTFKDPDSAMRACQDPSPVIDGRRANCNLASLGAAQRPRQPTPQHGFGRFRSVPSSAFPAYHGSMSKATYLNQSTQYPFPYSSYGYPAYSQESMYPMNYYSFYGGHQFSPYYTAAAAASGATSGMFQSFYPYYSQYASAAHSSSQAQGLGMQFPQMLQYPCLPQQQFNAGILSLPPSAQSTTAGSTVAAASSSLQTEPVSTTAENRPS